MPNALQLYVTPLEDRTCLDGSTTVGVPLPPPPPPPAPTPVVVNPLPIGPGLLDGLSNTIRTA
jgi:hypothetical protein